jgi:hypothetical protein
VGWWRARWWSLKTTTLETRYRLLETIRQYGEERLAEWGETEALRIRHASFYAGLLARAAERVYGPEQLSWARQINRERDNIRAAITNAIDAGNAALAVKLLADHPHRVTASTSPVGEVFPLPASRVLDLPGAAEQPGYLNVSMLAAYAALWNGDHESANAFSRRASEAKRRLASPLHAPGLEMELCALQAQALLSAGDYHQAVSAYSRAAEAARTDGRLGLAAQHLAYGVSTALLGGGGVEDAIAQAEESVALARQSGMPAAIALSLNALALALVEHDAERARALLAESIRHFGMPGQEISQGFLTACLVTGRLSDWELTLTLTSRSMYLYRWTMSPLHAATCLAECARGLADDRPDIAGVLQGAAYAALRFASPDTNRVRPDTPEVHSNANFVLAALRETGDIVAAALGDERRCELRTQGAAMSIDEAIVYALANIDRKLLTGPITVGV